MVLVHGLWHQPAHFEPLAEALRGLGATVHIPRLHRGSSANDTAAVQEEVDACAEMPILVGHSYGGSVITGLERVRHLVYVAAFVPAAGESGALLGGAGALVNDAVQQNDDGTTSIRPERAAEVLYGDCTEAERARATELLVPQREGHGRGVPSRVGWESTESTYIICEEDKALAPELQERMALRCTSTVRVPSSHSPFISQADRLAMIVMEI